MSRAVSCILYFPQSGWISMALMMMALTSILCSVGCATQPKEESVVVSANSPKSPIDPSQYFRITVVDEETGRGVPLVRLTACNHMMYYTDSAGVVAYYEPGLTNQGVFFHVESHGYTIEKDWLGSEGRTLRVEPGGSAEIKIKRENLAQRLYRITGSGIYADSVLLGDKTPIDEPLLNALVTGQDSTLACIYKGRLFWVWGDTGQPKHPLGANFKVTCATSELPEQGGLDPEVGVNLSYFKDGEGVKKMAPFPGKELVWLGSLVSVPDKDGRERLVARYVRVQAPMTSTGRGIAAFDDTEQVFKELLADATDQVRTPKGHCFKVTDQGTEYVYMFAEGLYRAPATYEALTDLSQYEGFTCLQEGADPKAEEPLLDRDADGRLRYSWKKNTPTVGWQNLQEWKRGEHIQDDELWFRLTDVLTGDELGPHALSIYWNEYRRRYVMIFSQIFGTSLLGEVWYAEADTPQGPWAYARKVLTHKDYSFYNPVQHPYFAKDGGRVIFFEGTYTRGFSGTLISTPRYDYNQIMYKLELDDPNLRVPVPVYRTEGSEFSYLPGTVIPERITARDVAFYALDNHRDGATAVYRIVDKKTGTLRLELSAPEQGAQPAFYAEPSDVEAPSACTTPLYVFTNRQTGVSFYSIEEAAPGSDFAREAEPLCLVWKKPTGFSPFAK